VKKVNNVHRGLNAKDFNIVKAFKSLPIDIETVFTCVLHLLLSTNIPVDRNGKLKVENNAYWKAEFNLQSNP
jgi:hypothetical protein